MTYAQLSSFYEPYHHQRRVLGFATFSGFPPANENGESSDSDCSKVGFNVDANIIEELKCAITLRDGDKALQHIPKTELIIEDATKTIPRFIDENQHIVVSIPYLDLDLYEPTKVELEYFIDRMSRGSV